jgi:tRNA (guanine-N7-)-methyltransferase
MTTEIQRHEAHSTGKVDLLAPLYELPSILERLDLTQLFSRAQPIEVELGCGDGSFLVAYAKQNPERNFLGVERLLGRVRKTVRKSARTGLKNLRLIRIESAYLLEFLLPRNSVSALHIYFPDPWPKRKHHRHRLINERFPLLASQTLVPRGRIYLRTDHPEYHKQMLEVFRPSALYRPVDTPLSLLELQTDFEQGFQARGIATLRAAYELIPKGN